MPGPGGGYTLQELIDAGGNVYHPSGRPDITIVYYQYPGTSDKSGEIEFTQNPKTSEFHPKAGDNADRYDALSNGKQPSAAPAAESTPKPQATGTAKPTADATPVPQATATPAPQGLFGSAGANATANAAPEAANPADLANRILNNGNETAAGQATDNRTLPADATLSGTTQGAPAATPPPTASPRGFTTSGGSTPPATDQQPPALPPSPIPTPVGYAPANLLPPGFQSAWNAGPNGVPIYSGNAARMAGDLTAAESNPGSVSLVSPQGGWGFNPFAIRAGLAGETPNRYGSAALQAFNIPFGNVVTGGPGTGTSGGRSVSLNAAPGTANAVQQYQDNPYGDNPIEQAMLGGALVKPVDITSNGTGQQVLGAMQPYKRGGFIHTPPIQQADNSNAEMPPTDYAGNLRAYAIGGHGIVAEPSAVIPMRQLVPGQTPEETLGEVRPEMITPKPGGFAVANHVPGMGRYAPAGANQLPSVGHADVGGDFNYSGAGGASADTGNAATASLGGGNIYGSGQSSTDTTSTSVPAAGGLTTLPTAAPTTSTDTTSNTNSLANTLGLPQYTSPGPIPQPPTQLSGGPDGNPIGGTGPDGQPTARALADPTYREQMANYLRNLDNQDLNLQSSSADTELKLLNALGSPQSDAAKLADANLQHQRDSTDYQYGVAGMHTPVEVQPPYAMPGSMPPSSTGLPNGSRYAIVTPQQQYSTLLQFAQNYFNAARSQIAATKALATVNQPSTSLSSQLTQSISRPDPTLGGTVASNGSGIRTVGSQLSQGRVGNN